MRSRRSADSSIALVGMQPAMEARAPDLVLVHERDAEPELGRTEGGGVATGAGAQDDEVEGIGRCGVSADMGRQGAEDVGHHASDGTKVGARREARAIAPVDVRTADPGRRARASWATSSGRCRWASSWPGSRGAWTRGRSARAGRAAPTRCARWAPGGPSWWVSLDVAKGAIPILIANAGGAAPRRRGPRRAGRGPGRVEVGVPPLRGRPGRGHRAWAACSPSPSRSCCSPRPCSSGSSTSPGSCRSARCWAPRPGRSCRVAFVALGWLDAAWLLFTRRRRGHRVGRPPGQHPAAARRHGATHRAAARRSPAGHASARTAEAPPGAPPH